MLAEFEINKELIHTYLLQLLPKTMMVVMTKAQKNCAKTDQLMNISD